MAGIAFIFDGRKRLEPIVDAIIQLPGEVPQIAIVTVDEAVDLRSSHIESVVEAWHRRAAAGAVMRAERAERIDGQVHLVLNGPGRRLSAHVVDRATDRHDPRHQGYGT